VCLPIAVLWPAGQLEEAEVALREVLGFDLPLPERLPVLARLAEVQLQEDSVETQAKVAAKLAEKIKEAGGDTSKVGGFGCDLVHFVCILCAFCVHFVCIVCIVCGLWGFRIPAGGQGHRQHLGERVHTHPCPA
jgi:hypothetical protein